MSKKAHMTHQRVTAKDEMTFGKFFWENAVAGDSVGKSEAELRARRADIFAGLVTALADDVAKELPVLSAMDIENIDPDRHIETTTALLEADELVTHLLFAIDEIKRQVAKTPKTRRRTEKDKKRRSIRD
jgi:hypothetical protein